MVPNPAVVLESFDFSLPGLTGVTNSQNCWPKSRNCSPSRDARTSGDPHDRTDDANTVQTGDDGVTLSSKEPAPGRTNPSRTTIPHDPTTRYAPLPSLLHPPFLQSPGSGHSWTNNHVEPGTTRRVQSWMEVRGRRAAGTRREPRPGMCPLPQIQGAPIPRYPPLLTVRADQMHASSFLR